MGEIVLRLSSLTGNHATFVDGYSELNIDFRTWKAMGEPHRLSVKVLEIPS